MSQPQCTAYNKKNYLLEGKAGGNVTCTGKENVNSDGLRYANDVLITDKDFKSSYYKYVQKIFKKIE